MNIEDLNELRSMIRTALAEWEKEGDDRVSLRVFLDVVTERLKAKCERENVQLELASKVEVEVEARQWGADVTNLQEKLDKVAIAIEKTINFIQEQKEDIRMFSAQRTDRFVSQKTYLQKILKEAGA